jgi:hypothetical protein
MAGYWTHAPAPTEAASAPCSSNSSVNASSPRSAAARTRRPLYRPTVPPASNNSLATRCRPAYTACRRGVTSPTSQAGSWASANSGASRSKPSTPSRSPMQAAVKMSYCAPCSASSSAMRSRPAASAPQSAVTGSIGNLRALASAPGRVAVAFASTPLRRSARAALTLPCTAATTSNRRPWWANTSGSSSAACAIPTASSRVMQRKNVASPRTQSRSRSPEAGSSDRFTSAIARRDTGLDACDGEGVVHGLGAGVQKVSQPAAGQAGADDGGPVYGREAGRPGPVEVRRRRTQPRLEEGLQRRALPGQVGPERRAQNGVRCDPVVESVHNPRDRLTATERVERS